MNQYTSRNDWLHSQVGFLNEVYVSGHPSFSKNLSLNHNSIVSLRFAANRKEIYGYFITIQASAFYWEEIEAKVATSEKFYGIYKKFLNLLNRQILIIIYDNDQTDRFSISEDLKTFNEVNSHGLKVYFSKYNPKIIENPGTFKEINKSINDSFQIWTRSNLSKYIVINDFDLFIPKKSLIIELKRVQERIEDWRPYLDDKGNYLSLLNICKSNGLEMLVIAYNYNRKEIALHIINEVNDRVIVGKYCICYFVDVLNENINDGFDFMNYVSDRRRR